MKLLTSHDKGFQGCRKCSLMEYDFSWTGWLPFSRVCIGSDLSVWPCQPPPSGIWELLGVEKERDSENPITVGSTTFG